MVQYSRQCSKRDMQLAGRVEMTLIRAPVGFQRERRLHKRHPLASSHPTKPADITVPAP